MKISRQSLHRMQNISNYCRFDLEKGVATISLFYERADEIIDQSRSSLARPVVSDSSIEKLGQVLKHVPPEFKVAFDISVEDYQDYNPQVLLSAYQHAFEDYHFSRDENQKSSKVLWIIIAILGILLVAIKVINSQNPWFGGIGSLSTLFFVAFIEIFSQIFFQESFVFYTISQSDVHIFKTKFKRLHELRIKDAFENVLATLDTKTFFEKNMGLGKTVSFMHNYILFFGPGYFAFILIQIFDFLGTIDNPDMSMIIFYIVISILVVLVMISNLAFYKGKHAWTKAAIVFSSILWILLAADFVLSMFTMEMTIAIWIFEVINVASLGFNIICLLYLKKKLF